MVSGARFQVSGFRCQVSGVRFRVSEGQMKDDRSHRVGNSEGGKRTEGREFGNRNLEFGLRDAEIRGLRLLLISTGLT